VQYICAKYIFTLKVPDFKRPCCSYT